MKLSWETKRARLKDLVEWELNHVQLTEKDAKHLFVLENRK